MKRIISVASKLQTLIVIEKLIKLWLGLSDIYEFYLTGHYEFPPYTEETKRSVYHVRNLEFFRMKQVSH